MLELERSKGSWLSVYSKSMVSAEKKKSVARLLQVKLVCMSGEWGETELCFFLMKPNLIQGTEFKFSRPVSVHRSQAFVSQT